MSAAYIQNLLLGLISTGSLLLEHVDRLALFCLPLLLGGLELLLDGGLTIAASKCYEQAGNQRHINGFLHTGSLASWINQSRSGFSFEKQTP